MLLPFIDRTPTQSDVERIRLLLSTYQDGTGMLSLEDGTTRPGWRDFERSVAAAFNGIASENKEVFDVILSRPEGSEVIKCGLSCKMRCELNTADRKGRVTIEVSNSSRKFWDYLLGKNIDHRNYQSKSDEVGISLIELVRSWHLEEGILHGGPIDLDKSAYLVLLWNKAGWYQLFQYQLDIVNEYSLRWSFPANAKRLVGYDESGVLVEWYGESGGQLKYYPLVRNAVWKSERFQLEPLPETKYGIIAKAEAYFVERWLRACQDMFY